MLLVWCPSYSVYCDVGTLEVCVVAVWGLEVVWFSLVSVYCVVIYDVNVVW